MKRALAVAALILMGALSSHAQVQTVQHRSLLGHVGHYVKTHKRLLVSDALIIAGQAADAASTQHCLHTNPFCAESNQFLGHHPSAAASYGYSLGFGAFLIGIDHTSWWLFGNENDKWRWLIFTNSAPVAISDFFAVKHNVNVAESYHGPALTAARQHLLAN